ncbi:signal peptidase I [Hazenella coriacea]|uniref:Signal peptidase I n=1 Tax=Hazenella coriacea TaxID=1179467 RepID=A0A4R3L602_9BACL|nr:signal peptidase I [Hazenella coriacea]TCS92809.1 signal peptidase I [Hazenella coriacea]
MKGKKVPSLYYWGLSLILLSLLVIGLNHFGVALSVVNGTSMQPTLHHGDRLLINKFKFLLDQPAIGEVITFQDPSNDHRFLVKRVIGIQGDQIEIKNGVLFRNNQRVDETYIDSSIEDGNFGPIVVKPGTVFVLGDNRHRYASRDSRYDSVGLVPVQLVHGKVEFILWRPSLAASL